MPLHELVPKYQIGPLKIGTKLGEEITQRSVSIEEVTLFQEYRGRSGMAVIVTGPDSIKPLYWSDNNAYGYVQTEGKKLTGEQINTDPIIGKRIKWVGS